MRTVVSGSRTLANPVVIYGVLARIPWPVTELIHGAAKRGVDSFVTAWARDNGVPVHEDPVTPVEWQRFGKAAGPRRNARLIERGEALVAIWDGTSRGTRDAITKAIAAGYRNVWIARRSPEEHPPPP